ncbi:MAG TPA: hypothetical protein VHU19_00395 [Pyrinomonadaceae bacterium]|jgi:hypothetical protein|nr:hypothetical protein [Pyrinomonadaceae bacterium]
MTTLTSAGYYPDGSQALVTSCCGRDGGVLHQCPHTLFSQPSWLPLLLAGVGIVCPDCRAVYDLGVKVEPQYPEAGEALKAVGLIAGVIVLCGVIANSLQGGNGKAGRCR